MMKSSRPGSVAAGLAAGLMVASFFCAGLSCGAGLARHNGRGGRCRCGRGLLRLGAALALDGRQLLEVVDVAFQFLDALLGFLELALLGDRVFGAAWSRPCRQRCRCRRRLRQAQLVLGLVGGGRAFLDLGGDLAAGALACLRGLDRLRGADLAGQLVAVGVEVGRVGDHDAVRLAFVQRLHAAGVRHRQDAARLQAVHVVADEGVRVGAVQRHQHHVERDVDRLQLGGDAAQAVARLDAVFRGGDPAGRLRRRRGLPSAARAAAAARTLPPPPGLPARRLPLPQPPGLPRADARPAALRSRPPAPTGSRAARPGRAGRCIRAPGGRYSSSAPAACRRRARSAAGSSSRG
jgi:hypothetical protein